MAEETWGEEEVPVLEAIRQAELEGQPLLDVNALLGRRGVDASSLGLILDRLYEDGFIQANRLTSAIHYPHISTGFGSLGRDDALSDNGQVRATP